MEGEAETVRHVPGSAHDAAKAWMQAVLGRDTDTAWAGLADEARAPAEWRRMMAILRGWVAATHVGDGHLGYAVDVRPVSLDVEEVVLVRLDVDGVSRPPGLTHHLSYWSP